MKMLPDEPTELMLHALRESIGIITGVWPNNVACTDIYAALLVAAPNPQQERRDERK